MRQVDISVRERNSVQTDIAHLIVSVRYINLQNNCCEITVGCPGLPNAVQTMYTGDAVLFETPSDGIIEVRMMSHNAVAADFLVSQVSPRLGISGGAVSDDPNNAPFSEKELDKIVGSINRLKSEFADSSTYTPEQLGLINRKLDEILNASTRLGRKDWINYVAGSLTGLCISAAFSPDTTKTFFKSVNDVFSWLFNNALQLLS